MKVLYIFMLCMELGGLKTYYWQLLCKSCVIVLNVYIIIMTEQSDNERIKYNNYCVNIYFTTVMKRVRALWFSIIIYVIILLILHIYYTYNIFSLFYFN